MAHNDIIVSRYKDFDPGTKWLENKRVYERAVGSFRTLVTKNFVKLGIPCVAMYPEVEKGKLLGSKLLPQRVHERIILKVRRIKKSTLTSCKRLF